MEAHLSWDGVIGSWCVVLCFEFCFFCGVSHWGGVCIFFLLGAGSIAFFCATSMVRGMIRG
jgi:hypothetical protein